MALPNHLTPMTVVPGERTLAAARNELQLRFESPDGRAACKLVKTYTFKRGDYTDRRASTRSSTTAAAPVTPQLYLQLARDGNPPEGESRFYFTFTGPAVYTDASKFQKIDFKDIEKGKRRATTKTRQQRLGGDGAALLRLGLAGAGTASRASSAPPRSTTTTYSVAHGAAAGRGGAGREQGATRRRCSPARRKRTSSPRWRRGWNW